MNTNPMQKKARNSFILGILITFVIMGMFVALLLVNINNMKTKEEQRLSKIKKVCVLKSDVKSGQIITSDIIGKLEVEEGMIPSNATNDFTNLENYFLEDKSGNPVVTSNGKAYLKRDDKNYELKIEESTGYYYIEYSDVKEYIDLASPALIAKVDMMENTILTPEMMTKSDEKTTSDLRLQEYNMISLASQIALDDYIDIRLRLPSGEDYIVISKKKVEMPTIGDIDSLNSIWLKLSEDEILTMSNAIVENYIIEGSLLYTAKYVEPGMQNKAIPTYVPSEDVKNLIENNDDNIIEKAKIELKDRYNDNKIIRDTINKEKNKVEEDDANQQISDGVKKEIEKAEEQRQSYLDSLAGVD